MRPIFKNKIRLFPLLACLCWSAGGAEGTIDVRTLNSQALAGNLVGISPEREIRVYLPEGYSPHSTRYPVLYYFHNATWSNAQLFGDGNNFAALLDRAIADGELPHVIVVAGDFRVPRFGTFFSNFATSGRWLDHIVDELIPFIDANYRTLPPGDGGRAAIGDFFGGYAVIRLAMDYPGLFSAIYAMHPVGTATGETLLQSRPDWLAMNTARSWDDLDSSIYSTVFMVMAQSWLPNPDKPPFFADLMVERNEDQLVINTENVRLLRERFLLDEQVPEKANALKALSD